MTTSQFPDHISFNELESLAQKASVDPQPEASDSGPVFGPDNISQDELLELVDKFAQESIDACNDPMIHKLLIMRMLSNFIDWHSRVGANAFAENEEQSGAAWLRDAGKFQACMCLLRDINVGPNDFVTPIE